MSNWVALYWNPVNNQKGVGMTELDVKKIKENLLRQRQEILTRLQDLEAEWLVLGEHDIEIGEEAQKADLTSTFDQLDGRERDEIKQIDLALTRMESASYGICEKCHKPISLQRLEVLPATSFCIKCAGKQEEIR
jgi:RNA polymerase-binding protein DksA